MIERNRPAPVGAELAAMYAHANTADNWREHQLRTDITIALGRSSFPDLGTVIDPAAGRHARTAAALAAEWDRSTITGDLAPDAAVDYPGVDARTFLRELYLRNYVADVVVLGEILEHVDDPGQLLRQAHDVANGLILSTPLSEPPDVNPEHVWRWDKAGILQLLDMTRWRPTGYVELELELKHWPAGYRCQIHTAEAIR